MKTLSSHSFITLLWYQMRICCHLINPQCSGETQYRIIHPIYMAFTSNNWFHIFLLKATSLPFMFLVASNWLSVLILNHNILLIWCTAFISLHLCFSFPDHLLKCQILQLYIHLVHHVSTYAPHNSLHLICIYCNNWVPLNVYLMFLFRISLLCKNFFVLTSH